ncbi:MAG: hypothetical protein R3E31_22305 [Chloroflexota bacterium]|nr:hypothetical protein [Anaerolineales bacterium]
MSKQTNNQATQPETPTSSAFAGFIFAAGSILAISYPVLALSTGVRAIYQIVEGETSNSPWLTLLASLFYTIATVGFLKQPRPAPKKSKPKAPSQFFLARWWRALQPAQAWKISLGVLALETVLTLLVGTLSYASPGLLGRNVWQYFGKDYGYLPLIQPLLGLAWLLHPQTLRNYNVKIGNR